MSGYAGTQQPEDTASDFNAATFITKQLIGKVQTATAVKVVAVTNSGGLAPAGTVDVLPLVNQIDGAGKSVPHGVIHGIPYSRMHGGTNAVIMDPAVGDIGICVFASRDISSVKANKGQANPGSRRRNDMADGMYVGGMLNGTPSQFIQFAGAGVTIHSPASVTISAPTINLNGNVVMTGNVTSNGHDISSTHRHKDTNPGGGLSGVPQ